jgi:hypothetical protein
MLASMGIRTGIDLDRLLALRAKVAGWLAGETLHGTLWRAGLPKTFRAAAEAALAGGRLDHDRAEAAGRAALQDAEPFDDAYASAWYRGRVLPVHVRRALLGEE